MYTCSLCSIRVHKKDCGCNCFCNSKTIIGIGERSLEQLNDLVNSGSFGSDRAPATIGDVLQRIIDQKWSDSEPKSYQTTGFDRQ